MRAESGGAGGGESLVRCVRVGERRAGGGGGGAGGPKDWGGGRRAPQARRRAGYTGIGRAGVPATARERGLRAAG